MSLVVSRDAAELAKDKQAVAEADAAVDRTFAAYTATDMTGREQAVEDSRTALTRLRTVRDERLLPLADAGNRTALHEALDREGIPALEAAVHALGLEHVGLARRSARSIQ